MRRLVNFAMFYVGWFVCVLGAAREDAWLGPATVAALLLVHFRLAPDWRREARLVLAIGLLGFALDTLQASAGLYAFTRASVAPWLCPLWMVALWMIFGSTLNASMQWLAGRYGVAAALGAVSGPASYAAGARLGAIELSASTAASLIGIAMVWALVMPALLALRGALTGIPAGVPSRPGAWVR